jgi:8-oxo-dGTP pyrophosphatase MutT (NUDIX family)
MEAVNTSTSLSAEEVVLVVDENNQIVGSAKRKEVRQKNLWHRASYIFVYEKRDGQTYILVQKRSMKKDYCPGFYDLANGGVMSADETDESNAQRELEEEIGMTGVEMKVLTRIKFEDPGNRVWGNVFAVEYDGRELRLQESEVDAIEKWTIKEAKAKIEAGEVKITPDSKIAFLEFLKLGIV